MRRICVLSLGVWLLVGLGCDSKEPAKSPPAKKAGAKKDGAKKAGAKTDGAKTDGAKTDGAKPDGAKPDAVKPDAVKPATQKKPDEATPPPGVKIKGNVPAVKASELAAEDKAREDCLSECVTAKQGQARGADDIEAGCRDDCVKKFPIRQVEVIPDGPEPAG